MNIINLIFPPKCIFCSNVLEDSTDIIICRNCYDEIPFIDLDLDEYLGLFRTDFCNIVVCPCKYEGVIKKALTDFKFRDRPSLYRALAYLIINELEKLIKKGEIDLVIAVPLSRKRFSTRGYNQAGLLASYLAKYLNAVNASSVLKRTRDTMKQAGLDKNCRKSNVLDAFTVLDRKYVANKKILLVDDIFTTGNTINECSRALISAGAAKVYAAVVASGRNF